MIKALIIYMQIASAFIRGNPDTLKMFFLGDIMQHKAQLESAYKGSGERGSSDSYDYSHYFQYLKPLFADADIVAANMETTFGPAPYSGYPVFCSPESLAIEAVKSGINLLFAANNHSADKRGAGLKGSLKLYRQLKEGNPGVYHTGIYSDRAHEEEMHPLIVEKKGIRIAFLNYTYGTNGIPVPEPYVVKLLDSAQIIRDLEKARHSGVDFTIVSVHWGDEYILTPSLSQKRWERLFYRYGTDIIIGSHPHVPQDVVTYSCTAGEIQRVTAYSLGNAISNMTAANTRIGLMLEISITKDYANRKSILKPVSHYIWTSRPAATGGHFTIIPIKDYLENPSGYKIVGEDALIKRYYSSFVK